MIKGAVPQESQRLALSFKKKASFSVIGALILTLGIVMLGEVAVRLYGSADEIGDFYVRSARIKPYHEGYPPRLDEKLAEYLSNSSPWVRYDPDLGWVPSPNGRSLDGLYEYNSSGIRSDVADYSTVPKEGVLRIALFGDSFTEGAEVPFASSWGHYLEKYLNEAGVDAEVLNFGVSAYGMDQAFLRWKKDGRRFSPDLVIFGFQAENAKRNLNLFRPFYNGRTGVIFTKPRFVFNSDQLKLINVPTVPPEELRDVIGNFGTWQWADDEYYYDRSDNADRIWRKSKLFSLIENRLEGFGESLSDERAEKSFYRLDNSGGRLALAIIDKFNADVEANDAQFIIVHFPKRKQVVSMTNGGEPEYSELLEELFESYVVIDPADELVEELKASSLESLFMEGGHPSDKANQMIAREITDYLAEQWD